jgi:hypothetical protein
LQELRRVPFRRLAHQQVNVFRHHHIAHDSEFVSRTDFVENLYETISRSSRPEVRTPAVATESHEMEIVLTIMAP